MDPAIVLRHVQNIYAGHAHRLGEFLLPSAVHVGHALTVRRLDENHRAVSQSDIYFLMHSTVAPGCTQVMRHYTGNPCKKFAVYLSADPVHALSAALEQPKRTDRARSA